ncbi:MAG: DUF1330 domain-containing protein [Hyphomicrobiales bacterium]|nr:DUF1330 domain-containing protein [Hyphomicrobiales bacterium]
METQAAQFTEWYGNGNDGSSPTNEQWRSIVARPPEEEITLINFFKLRHVADYSAATLITGAPEATGQDAFNAYAGVSIPTMERVGGKFLFVGPFGGMFLGPREEWDIIAVGNYPNLQALIDLYSDADYRKAFAHRTAACERQKVIVGNAMG